MPTGLQFVAGGLTRAASRIYIVGAEANPGAGVPPGNTDVNPDVALIELATAFPAANAQPLNISAGRPSTGTQSTMYGMSVGGNGACPAMTEAKRYYTFNFGNFTQQFCKGDSGGPATYFSNTANGAIWGVASFSPASGDVWGDVSRFKEDILSVIRLWDAGNSSGLTGLETGFRRIAPVLSTISNTTAANCRTSCNSNSSCNSFAYSVPSSSCQLFRAVGDWVPDANYVSGLSTTKRFESNTDRGGFDYDSYSTTSSSTCSRDCSDDSRCAAFSWVASTTTCYLKEYLGQPTQVTGVTSGTKRGFEHYTDRAGNDIDWFDQAVPDVRVCQAACSAHSSCNAYTYVSQRFLANGITPDLPARCYLKNPAPSPVTTMGPLPVQGRYVVSGTWKSTP